MPEVGLETHPRLPSPDFESALLKDRDRHREIGGDKTAFYRVFLSLGRTRRDRERHPVAVRLRSPTDAAQTLTRESVDAYMDFMDSMFSFC